MTILAFLFLNVVDLRVIIFDVFFIRVWLGLWYWSWRRSWCRCRGGGRGWSRSRCGSRCRLWCRRRWNGHRRLRLRRRRDIMSYITSVALDT
jgi:hypothetical protein